MVAGAIAGNISGEATTPTGNSFAEAMRGHNPGPADPAANAARLIALLPRSPNFIPGHDPASTDEPDHSRLLVIYLLFGLMMIVCAALGHWLRSFN